MEFVLKGALFVVLGGGFLLLGASFIRFQMHRRLKGGERCSVCGYVKPQAAGRLDGA